MGTKKESPKAAPVSASAPAELQRDKEAEVVKPTTSVSAEQLRRDREQVTAIACALLQSPGYSLKLRDEQHQAHLVNVAMQIAEKINTAVKA